jgi:hypothetical protein
MVLSLHLHQYGGPPFVVAQHSDQERQSDLCCIVALHEVRLRLVALRSRTSTLTFLRLNSLQLTTLLGFLRFLSRKDVGRW